MASYVTSEPKKIYTEDVQFSSSVSEAVANKIGAAINFILDEFIVYKFGVTGGVYSGLSSYPYVFTGCMENVFTDSKIHSIEVFNEVSGISGTTVFYIEKQSGVGAWTTIFSTNAQIVNTAADNLYFSTLEAAPSGVTLPILSTIELAKNDKLRFVLQSAATDAKNLSIKVKTRPV
jgi:hypothetical protein